jgi:drug/metabolite transporter (DMT)-like permease
LLAALLLWAARADADSLVEPRGLLRGVFPGELLYVNALISTAAGASAITTLLENGIIGRTGYRPPHLWRVLGYAMGAASVGQGALNIALSQGEEAMVGAGCALIAIGLADIGLVMWGSRNTAPFRGQRPPLMVFGPRVLTDAAGRPAYGIGVSLTNW